MCHSCIKGWSGFTVYQAPISTLLQWSVWFVNGQTNQGLQAGFSLTLLWPGFHFPPEAASPTVMVEDKQVEITAIVVPGATTNLREGERDTPRPKLTDRNHWPSYPRVTQINVVLFFFPSAGMAYFLNQAIVSQNTKYFSTTAGPTYRNPLWMGLIVEEKEKEKKRDGKKNLGMLLAFNSFSLCMET